jgi:hypothetical protein
MKKKAFQKETEEAEWEPAEENDGGTGMEGFVIDAQATQKMQLIFLNPLKSAKIRFHC